MQEEKYPVSNYDTSIDAIDGIFQYPGKRPRESYITNGSVVEILPNNFANFYDTADRILRQLNLPGMDVRIPVLSYGANAAPHFLAKKMKKFDVADEVNAELNTVPHCRAVVKDSIAAWHGRTSQVGGVFAELVKSPETLGTDLYAHIAFMTTEQLAIISVTEGATYSLAEVEVLVGDDQRPKNVLAYIALDSSIRTIDGSPVAVKTIPHTGKEPLRKEAKEVVRDMLEESQYPISNPVLFAEEALAMTLTEKKKRQAKIGVALDVLGTRLSYKYPVNEIPEMVLSRIRPTSMLIKNKIEMLRTKNGTLTEKELAIKALSLIDPARLLSRRAHDEIKQRLHTTIDK